MSRFLKAPFAVFWPVGTGGGSKVGARIQNRAGFDQVLLSALLTRNACRPHEQPRPAVSRWSTHDTEIQVIMGDRVLRGKQ
jgi:hypothetical protein